MTASCVALAGLATTAEAFFFNNSAPQYQYPYYYRPAPPVQRPVRPSTDPGAREKSDKEAAEELAPKAKGILGVFISIDKQRLTLYSDGQPIAHSKVSTGTASHPTPTGVFSVIQKDRWHRSNLYDNAPMFYMQRITWSGVAMHQGVVPNHPASHGCIRLPEAFAKQLWGVTRLGVRVIIARNELVPVAIAHKRLFKLRREQPPEAQPEQAVSSTDVVRGAHGALEVAQLPGSNSKPTAADVTKPTDVTKSGKPAFDAMAYAMGAPRETPATSSEVVKSAPDGFEAPKVRRMKSTPVTTAVAEVRALKPGPISVFISRKEGKLFVRKGFEPLFDVPVTFEQPERPLGTHVFTALSVNDDNTTMRWNVVSVPTTAKPEKGKKPEWTGPASTAAEALDRVTIPPEALDRISELMSPGASLIISDQGLGPETGTGTDFIVLTR
jgi:lipoprotein-anchoring transpeptidase ErfK/SrfK